VGCSETTVRGWIHEGKVATVPGVKRQLLSASDVDRRRAERLGMFDGVVDVTAGSTPSQHGGLVAGAPEPSLQLRVLTLEAQLRQVIASRATTNEALQLLLRGEQGLLDALLATLPADHSGLLEAGPRP
jgi:hypothetical protein